MEKLFPGCNEPCEGYKTAIQLVEKVAKRGSVCHGYKDSVDQCTQPSPNRLNPIDINARFEELWRELPQFPWFLRWTWLMVKRIASYCFSVGYYYGKGTIQADQREQSNEQ